MHYNQNFQLLKYDITYLFHRYGLVFDSSIPFINFYNYYIVHFNKKSFRIVKSKIEMIDVDFISTHTLDYTYLIFKKNTINPLILIIIVMAF